MCGIAGRWNFRSGASVDPGALAAMARLLAHRGPDAEGVHADGPLGFAHRRLAVIDLSDAGRQPMATADGSIWITFNGEIYNFLDLRRELERRGAGFRTRTDTEVILAAYREWGPSCVDRLRGMFAFALWDGPRQTLLLARDRVGKKPLCYWLDEDGIAFASEPKAFLGDPGFRPEVDLPAITYYLTYQYVPAPRSAFKGVQKLPPAHRLIVRDGAVSTERYWRLHYLPKRQVGEAEAAEAVLDRLREAVRVRLISDVPLGAFLSGGVDSSAIVALMAEQSSRAVKTFSIGFEESDYNELPYARQIAERYATDHHEFIVRPDAVEILPQLVWHYNEPFADSSAIPSYYLAELTRRHVTVALNGDGGDESFAGYERYVLNDTANRYDHVPAWIRRPLNGLAARLPPRPRRSLLGRARRFAQAMSESRERRYALWLMHFQPTLRAELCTPAFLGQTPDDTAQLMIDEYAASDADDFVDQTLDVDVNRYLPDDLLVKMDIATMAHGLEARSPLLDHELMEYAASLPAHLKLRGRTKKYILKKALAALLPQGILDRPKMGFGVPLDHWFRHELRAFATDILTSAAARGRGYFNMAVIDRLLDQHAAGTHAWHAQLWNLVVLELWHRMFIDTRPRAAPRRHATEARP